MERARDLKNILHLVAAKNVKIRPCNSELERAKVGSVWGMECTCVVSVYFLFVA